MFSGDSGTESDKLTRSALRELNESLFLSNNLGLTKFGSPRISPVRRDVVSCPRTYCIPAKTNMPIMTGKIIVLRGKRVRKLEFTARNSNRAERKMQASTLFVSDNKDNRLYLQIRQFPKNRNSRQNRSFFPRIFDL